MQNNSEYKKGDIIVNFGKIYIITKIADKKNFKGEMIPHIFYKTYIKNGKVSGLTCALPLKNIEITNKRKLASEDELKNALEVLGGKLEIKKLFSKNEAKEIYLKNNLVQIAKVVRQFWEKRENDKDNFTITDRGILERGLKHFYLETAVIKNIDIKEAKQEINKILK